MPLEYATDLDPLLDRIGNVRCVLIGEASHGTHEFYAWRAAFTRRLIAEQGFDFVVVEGDWPDCWNVHRSVTLVDDTDPGRVLDDFRRWPTWMWANQETVNFCRWLREHNTDLPYEQRAGWFGLDVYSLWDSLRAIIDYLRENRPDYLDTAFRAYRCFEPYDEDPQAYAWDRQLVPEGCTNEVLDLLTKLERPTEEGSSGDRWDELNARQNAEVAADAERYYRSMIGGGPESWNVRDTHMADTLDRLLEFHGPRARGIVWAHNTHVGDARATDMARNGLVNIGQLARERHGADRVVLVGFASGHGEVIAAPRWDGRMRRMPVPPPRVGSLEALLGASGLASALFVPEDAPGSEWSTALRGHRAIGVVYDPDRDQRNFVPTRVGQRYDALCWFTRTSALEPLHFSRDPERLDRPLAGTA